MNKVEIKCGCGGCCMPITVAVIFWMIMFISAGISGCCERTERMERETLTERVQEN